MKPGITTDESLVVRHQGLIYYVLNKYNCTQSDDAQSIGYEALWRAIKTYDVSQGTEFSTYAVTCIRNALFGYFRELKEVRDAEVPFEEFYNLCTYEEAFVDSTEPEIDYGPLYKAVDDALNRLHGKKLKIAKTWLKYDMSATALAQEVQCSQSYVSQCIAEFKAMLRKDLYAAGYSQDNFTATKYV